MQFYISAAHKSSGKTTVSIGLSAALTHLGRSVQTFKRGPDYIDPIWLQHASGKPCYNLDFNSMSHEEIQQTYQDNNDEVRIVEGNKGLFDGLKTDGSDSNAALANLLNIPVILVIDCIGITRGIAPLLNGYLNFNHPATKINGIILNKVGGARHEQKLRSAIEQFVHLPVIGAIPKNSKITIDERHLGLIPSNESNNTNELINNMRDMMLEHIDFKMLNDICQTKNSAISIPATTNTPKTTLKIAIAQDSSFGFYYAQDLEQFRKLGVELIIISILDDLKLPDNIDGLFIGGGFPETHFQQISENQSMLKSIKNKLEDGLPCYAECGGMMILTKKISYNEKSYPMCGFIKADCIMKPKPQGRGYVKITTQNHPWGLNQEIKAHEFHYSKLSNFTQEYKFAYKVTRGTGIKNGQDGLIANNLLASYSHLKNSSNLAWVKSFIDFCKEQRNDT